MCHLRRGADDTWDTGDLIGEVETLVVAPTERASSLGTALMDAAERQFAQLGAHDVMAAVMEGNDRAMEFYRRRGMTPTVTFVMRVRETRDEPASDTWRARTTTVPPTLSCRPRRSRSNTAAGITSASSTDR